MPTDVGGSTESAPIVILMIGDGMGRGQLEVASRHAHGAPNQLFMQSLPVHGELITSSLSGITDSAASATAMATGVKTLNTRIGMDAEGQPLPTLVEVAKDEGMATGLVTTSYLPHATPGSFSAHRPSRHDPLGIADDQALVVRPEVMLGGGAAFFLPAGEGSYRDDAGLLDPLRDEGYAIVFERDELMALDQTTQRVLGLFAPEHLDYVLDRTDETTQPTLAQMTVSALDILARDPQGAFLVVEGARIDMASHLNDVERTLTETIAFDEAVQAVSQWAGDRDDVTVLVTADHECGGLVPDPRAGRGELPEVSWRWGQHTNARVDVFGWGPGTELFDGTVHDMTWVHAALLARISDATVQPPSPALIPDGHLSDLRHRAVVQDHPSSYGEADNRIDALWLDVDERGLAVGLEGLFKWERNTLVILLDLDYGAATGFSGLAGNLADGQGRIDATLSSLALTAPDIPEFGADIALASWGGREIQLEELGSESGTRAIAAPLGRPDDFAWLASATNFGEGVRLQQGESKEPIPNEGFEALIPWTVLFPDLDGAVVPGTRIGVVAVLTNDDGTHLSNQALPPYPSEEEPGSASIAIPGVVEFVVDVDEDGWPDGDEAPVVH